MTGCTRVSGVKAPLSGLVSIASLPKQRVASVQNMSVSVPWSALQPSSSSQLVRPNAIDDAITSVRQLGDCDAGVEVRVLAGVNSPEWAKQLSGPPVSMQLKLDNLSGTVPRFWEKPFQDAYAKLQRTLAQTYDNVPEIRLVAMSMCTTFYAEPMLRQNSDGSNTANLLAAGYTMSKDLDCQTRQIQAQQVWTRTRSLLALNPYQRVGAGRQPPDVATAVDVGRECRNVLGSRCVLGNNSVRWPPLQGAYGQLYDQLKALGQPLSFQAAGPSRVGDLDRTAQWVADLGGGSLEITSQQASTPTPQLSSVDRDLVRNAEAKSN